MVNFFRFNLLFTLILSAFSQITVAEQAQTNLPQTKIKIGAQIISVQTAKSDAERNLGLMFTPQLATNDGMLFVYQTPAAPICFWMKNTLIPLSAAFINTSGKIVFIADMQPLDETPHCTNEISQYVLEMNQGWFGQNKIKVGDQILFLD